MALVALQNYFLSTSLLTPFVVYTFAGGFNQPIMCGGEPRAMLRKTRGKNDSPFYTIQICIPKHGWCHSTKFFCSLAYYCLLWTFFLFAAVNLIFSFTNGVDWDGPYKVQFEVPKAWRNKPVDFFNQVIRYTWCCLNSLPLAWCNSKTKLRH